MECGREPQIFQYRQEMGMLCMSRVPNIYRKKSVMPQHLRRQGVPIIAVMERSLLRQVTTRLTFPRYCYWLETFLKMARKTASLTHMIRGIFVHIYKALIHQSFRLGI